jgi:hypothetical protein
MPSPITVERFVEELEKLHQGITSGDYKPGEYDQRLAKTIQELRERRIDGDRSQIAEALDTCLERGTITDSVRVHLQKRLDLD